jgi:hypothetical protein
VLRLEQLIKSRIISSAAFLAGRVRIPQHIPPELYPTSQSASQQQQQQQLSPDGGLAAQQLMLDCMSRIKVVAPANTSELLIALEALYHELGDGAVVVLLDSLGSFHARDKAAAGGETLQNALMAKLALLRNDRAVIILAAKPGNDTKHT